MRHPLKMLVAIARMVLFIPAGIAAKVVCPNCNARHVDAGVWRYRAHRAHLCHNCRRVFWPPDWPYATRGEPYDYDLKGAAILGVTYEDTCPVFKSSSPVRRAAGGFHYGADGHARHPLSECRAGVCWTDEPKGTRHD